MELVRSMDELVPYALIGVDHRQAAAVRPFLRSLLAMNLSDEEMADFWSSTPSGIYFTEGERVRTFLSALLRRLEEEPYLTGLVDIPEFVISIYCNGLAGGFLCRGQQAYLEDRDFLDKLTGREYHNYERPVPDPDHDTWVLDDQQYDAYLDFRKARRERNQTQL